MPKETRATRTQLITMVACWTQRPRVEELLEGAGVKNYTVSLVEGRGERRGRKFGELEFGNIKVEALAPLKVAAKVLAAVDAGSGEEGITVFVYDVRTAPTGTSRPRSSRTARAA